MAKYVKREDAVKTLTHLFFETAFNNCGIDDDYARVCADIAANRVDGYVSAVPDADVVEVVRCRDCKYCRGDLNGMPVCNCNKRVPPFYTDPDFYCAYGERRTEEDGQT